MSDPVNNPAHYKSHPSGIECIQITEHMGFNLGNATKYLWRSSLKHPNPILDLKKAIWYVEREIQRLEKLYELENIPERSALRSEPIGPSENEGKDSS
jgi:hypothetical protein